MSPFVGIMIIDNAKGGALFMNGALAAKKSQRLYLITALLNAHPHGLSTRELAVRCGVTQRTIQRDLLDLQSEPIRCPLLEENRKWKILPGARFLLPPVQFTLEEATALFLAARLLSRYADESVPAVNAGLEKLAAILPPAIGDHIRHTVEAMRYKPANPRFEDVFRTITLGWATRRKVRIWHQSAGSEHVHEYVLSPYFIEPSSVGYATYVIGHASYFEAVYTFKIERIQRAELTDESFEVPADFNGPTLLESAWGVMYGKSLQEVVLRFSPAVTRRVHESVWHPSQEVVDEPDGGCRLRVRVAEPMEMKPWIRGWGPECEVVEPAWLREEIAAEMKRAAERYANDTEGEENP